MNFNARLNKGKSRILTGGLILLLVSLLLTAYTKQQHPGLTHPMQLFSTSLTYPIVSLVAGTVDSLGKTYSLFQRQRVVDSENQKLRELVELLRFKIQVLRGHRAENQRLRRLLSFYRGYNFRGRVANVVSFWSVEGRGGAVIDLGSRAGLAVNQAVITGDGLLGQLSFVGANFSKVLSVVDPSNAIDVITSHSRERGILKGVDGKKGELKFISTYSAVKSGEQLLTTGSDGIFPEGILVGTITKISEATQGMFRKIEVKPAVLPWRANLVAVLKVTPRLRSELRDLGR